MDQLTAHLDRGWDLVSRGDFAGALVSAQKSVESDPNSPEAHNLLGYVLAADGRADEAVEHYRTAIELDDTFVEAMLNAAEVLVHPLKEYDAALAMIDEALDLVEGDDEIADAMLLKFDALRESGDQTVAAKLVAALPEGPFQNPHLEFLIGRARYEVGDLDGAEPLIRKAAQEAPQDPEVQYYLGLVLESRSDLRQATLAFLRSRDVESRMGPPPHALSPEEFEKAVEGAVRALGEPFAKALDGAFVVVTDLPGVEVVAEGVDPRTALLLDDVSAEGESPRVGRLFVYQRNVERISVGAEEVQAEVSHAIEHELAVAFPSLSHLHQHSFDRGARGGPSTLN